MSLPLRAGRFFYRKLGLSRNEVFKNQPMNNVLDAAAANNFIGEVIKKGQPAMISRFGTPESNCLLNYLELLQTQSANPLKKLHGRLQHKRTVWDDEMKAALSDLVGFFPTDNENLYAFSKFYIKEIEKMDAIGVWGFVPGETYLIHHYCSKATRFDPTALEPYFFDNPWSQYLEGKKVLVIHPFEKSVIHQYQHREKIFTNKKILPGFDLKTIAAVQSIAGNKTAFSTWFDALEYMKKQIDSTDFDVALIGAGSYGLPLSAYIKDKGKISIHIGGATQILFGIKGKRWDDHPVISKFYNDNWVRPSADETVPKAQVVEGACYW